MIGIVGFGRFGKLMASYFTPDFTVMAYDTEDKSAEMLATGASPASLEEVCRQKVVVLGVPISILKDTLKTIAPLLLPGSLVVDVCSVKQYPFQWMKELLPESVSFLPTHPMFGPDSAADSLKGRKIVLCKGRIEKSRYRKVKEYLVSKDLVVIETTPEEHDRNIAVSLSLTHFIGRALSEFGAEKLHIDTEGYKRLLHILGVVKNDTWQLFYDMNKYNPYAGEKRAAFLEAMQSIEKKLNA